MSGSPTQLRLRGRGRGFATRARGRGRENNVIVRNHALNYKESLPKIDGQLLDQLNIEKLSIGIIQYIVHQIWNLSETLNNTEILKIILRFYNRNYSVLRQNCLNLIGKEFLKLDSIEKNEKNEQNLFSNKNVYKIKMSYAKHSRMFEANGNGFLILYLNGIYQYHKYYKVGGYYHEEKTEQNKGIWYPYFNENDEFIKINIIGEYKLKKTFSMDEREKDIDEQTSETVDQFLEFSHIISIYTKIELSAKCQ